MKQSQSSKRAYIMLISSLLIVGTIGAFRREIPLSSALLVFFRGVIGAGSLLLFALLRRKTRARLFSAKTLLLLTLNGVFLGVNWMLLFEAYRYTTIAKATLCYYLQPTIVLLLSPILFHERLTPKKTICAFLSFAGMVLVSGLISSAGTPPDDLKGTMLGLGAACFYALVVILNKKIDDVDPMARVIVQLLSAAVILLPYLLLTEDFSGIVFDRHTVFMLLVIGVVHTAVVYVLYFGSMHDLPAQTISALGYLDPVVALFVSAIVLKEPMSFGALLGSVMILGSALISEISPRSAREEQPTITEND